jgi:hypothetical protein
MQEVIKELWFNPESRTECGVTLFVVETMQRKSSCGLINYFGVQAN